MKHIKWLVLGCGLAILVFGWSISYANETENSTYKAPIATERFNFSAKLNESGSVEMTWNAFKTFSDKNLKFYKVIRSSKNANPVYPEDGYLTYDTNPDFTSYTDTNPQTGVNFYRVCAITEDMNRYCSRVVRIVFWIKRDTATESGTLRQSGRVPEKEWKDRDEDSSGSTTGSGQALEKRRRSAQPEAKPAMRPQVRLLIEKFSKQLDAKFGTDTESKLSAIETAKTKLQDLKVTKPNLTNLIDEVLRWLNTLKEKLSADTNSADIETILQVQ